MLCDIFYTYQISDTCAGMCGIVLLGEGSGEGNFQNFEGKFIIA